MNIKALFDAGRYDELIPHYAPASQAGDAVASANLAVIYRRMGDTAQALAYTLRAYRQDPHAPEAVTTMLRTLLAQNDIAAIAALYQAAPGYAGWTREQHLKAADALVACNRLDAARIAVKRAGAFPGADSNELVLALRLARAAIDTAAAHALLDRLEAAGMPKPHLRLQVHVEAGEMQEVLDLHRSFPADLARETAKSAMLAALTLEDREAIAALADTQTGGVRATALAFLEGRTTMTVDTATRRYIFPFLASNLSLALPHAAGNFYERATLEVLKRFVPAGGIVVDVGANIGNHTAFFAGEAGATVFPFECNPDLIGKLRETVALSGLEDRVRLDHLGQAVSNEIGETHFNFMRNDFSNIGGSEGAIVPTVTLDSVEVPRCDLLKIDVDGGELNVLAGAAQFVARHRPVISIESLLTNVLAVLRWFEEHDYTAFREDTSAECYSDFIFVPR